MEFRCRNWPVHQQYVSLFIICFCKLTSVSPMASIAICTQDDGNIFIW